MFSRLRACKGTRAARKAMLLPVAFAALMASPAIAQNLTLEEAMRRALAAAPQNGSVVAQVDALTANRAAADLPPRPSLEIATENFGPPSDSLYDQFQITGTYNQQIERGGKRQARVTFADRQIDVALAQAVVRRLEIISDVQLAYVEVQAAEAAIGVARERLAIAQSVATEVDRRVASARDPIFAGTRARASVAEAEVDLELAVHARDAALVRLSQWWGGSADRLIVPIGRFLDLAPMAGPMEPSPTISAIYQAAGAQADAAIAVRQADSVRDLTLSGGPRFIGTGDVGFVFGVSVPLGGRRLAEARVAEAQAERQRVDAEREVEMFNLRRAITLAAERVEKARHEADAIQGQVLPLAEKALSEVRAGYQRGFFSFADLAAAQTASVDAAMRTVDAAREYHEAKVELDRLTGRFSNLAEEASQ